MFRAPRGGNRSYDARLRPEGCRVAAHQTVVGRRKLNVEFCLHLLMPLPDECCGRQDEDALRKPAQQVLLEGHAPFDALAQPYFISQQNAPAKLLEHFAYCFGLIPIGFNVVQERQTKQLVEALQQTELRQLISQTKGSEIICTRDFGGYYVDLLRQVEGNRNTRLSGRQRRCCFNRLERFVLSLKRNGDSSVFFVGDRGASPSLALRRLPGCSRIGSGFPDFRWRRLRHSAILSALDFVEPSL